MLFPTIQKATLLSPEGSNKRVLIISEGFEGRSLSWIKLQPEKKLFGNSIVCKYEPSKKQRFEEMKQAVIARTCNQPYVLAFNRFEPTSFEVAFESTLGVILSEATEIVIDISAMSKMLIMIILHSLRHFSGAIRIIYTEPSSWSPTEAEFIQKKKDLEQGSFVSLSSIGVFNIVRTPGLSSITMQDSPSLLIAFASTNAYLVNAVANDVIPEQTLLINAKNSREPWRESAALEIQKQFIRDFPLYSDEIHAFELIEYAPLFNFLAEVYKDNCYDKRIIISPTGGKIHTISCALIKNCCSDIHIEYPTPESYLFDSFTSDEYYAVHQIEFQNYSSLFINLRKEFGLDG